MHSTSNLFVPVLFLSQHVQIERCCIVERSSTPSRGNFPPSGSHREDGEPWFGSLAFSPLPHATARESPSRPCSRSLESGRRWGALLASTLGGADILGDVRTALTTALVSRCGAGEFIRPEAGQIFCRACMRTGVVLPQWTCNQARRRRILSVSSLGSEFPSKLIIRDENATPNPPIFTSSKQIVNWARSGGVIETTTTLPSG